MFPKKEGLISEAEFTRRVQRIFETLSDTHGGLRFKGKTIRYKKGTEEEVRPALQIALAGKSIEIRTGILEEG